MTLALVMMVLTALTALFIAVTVGLVIGSAPAAGRPKAASETRARAKEPR